MLPEQIVESGVSFITGRGFTVMVNVLEGPGQSFPPKEKVGVTVIVATTGAKLLLTAANGAMFPFPEGARPMEGVSFIQA